jgi:NDP-sugar pyrophosphorylase family protein
MGNDKEEPNSSSTDTGELIYTYNRELFYHFDKEKGFTQKVDYQNPNNQIIIKQSWDAAEQRLDEVKQQVIIGKSSPIAYYMEKILMEVPMLAAYMEIPKWRVRRHLKSKVFKKIKPEILEKYASVFGIPVDQLIDPDFLK